jgi:hypothetical protein
MVVLASTLTVAVAYIALQRWAEVVQIRTPVERVARVSSLGSIALMTVFTLVSLAFREADGCKWAEKVRDWLGEKKQKESKEPKSGEGGLGMVTLLGPRVVDRATGGVAMSAAVIAVLLHLLPAKPPVINVAPSISPSPAVLVSLPALQPVVQAGSVNVPPQQTDPAVRQLLGQLVDHGLRTDGLLVVQAAETDHHLVGQGVLMDHLLAMQAARTDERLVRIHDNAQAEQTNLRALAGGTGAVAWFLDAVKVRADADGHVLPPPLDAVPSLSTESGAVKVLTSGTSAFPASAPWVEVPAPGDDVVNRQRDRRPKGEGQASPGGQQR